MCTLPSCKKARKYESMKVQKVQNSSKLKGAPDSFYSSSGFSLLDFLRYKNNRCILVFIKVENKLKITVGSQL